MIAAATGLAGESLGRFHLTTTFDGTNDVAFSYTGGSAAAAAIASSALVVTGTIDVSAGTFAASPTGFN